jgi:hypothetical protein
VIDRSEGKVESGFRVPTVEEVRARQISRAQGVKRRLGSGTRREGRGLFLGPRRFAHEY